MVQAALGGVTEALRWVTSMSLGIGFLPVSDIEKHVGVLRDEVDVFHYQSTTSETFPTKPSKPATPFSPLSEP